MAPPLGLEPKSSVLETDFLPIGDSGMYVQYFRTLVFLIQKWLRGRELNPQSQGYEPRDLPICPPRIDRIFQMCYISSVHEGNYKGNVTSDEI